MNCQGPDNDLINFDSPRLPKVPEIEISPENEDDHVDKENCSGVGNEVAYFDSTFRLTDNSCKSICNDSANGQTLIDLTPQNKMEDGHQNESRLVKFDNSDLVQQNESYDALGIVRVDNSHGNESAVENSLNEKQLEFDSADCSSNEKPADDVSTMSADVSCYCDTLEVVPPPSPNDKQDKNVTMKPGDTIEYMDMDVDMELDETVVEQSPIIEQSASEFIRSAAEFMTVAYEGPVDPDISDFTFESHSTSAEMEKHVVKIHEQSQEEKQDLNVKTKNIINFRKYYEASSEDLQYLYWQKAILDDEFKRNSDLAARDINETVDRTEKIQRQIDIVDELTFENNQLKEMQARVKLMIELIHKKDENIKRLNGDVGKLEQEVIRVEQDAADERAMLRNDQHHMTEKLEKLSEENAKLKNRQVEKQVENLNLLKELQELRIAHECDRAKLDAKSETCNRNLQSELEELKVARDNDWAKLTAEMDEKVKAEETKAFNYYVAVKSYQESWNTFHEKYDNVQRLNRKMSDDLGILEVAFKNVVDKFEKSKSVIEGYKANEVIYEENIKKYKAKLEEEYERFKTLKTHASTRFDEANKQYLEMRVAGDTTAKKQSAIIRRLEIKLSATEDLLMQKNTECDRLAKLCDEVTGSV